MSVVLYYVILSLLPLCVWASVWRSQPVGCVPTMAASTSQQFATDRISATSERLHKLAKCDRLHSVNVRYLTPGALLRAQ